MIPSPPPLISMAGKEQSEKALCSPNAPCVGAGFVGQPLNSTTHSSQGSLTRALRAESRCGRHEALVSFMHQWDCGQATGEMEYDEQSTTFLSRQVITFSYNTAQHNTNLKTF